MLENCALRLNSSSKFFITVRNEVAMVVSLHVSVILSTGVGGVCLSACWDTTPLGTGTPLEQAPPESKPPPSPGRRLLLRTVRILLECILVFSIFFLVSNAFMAPYVQGKETTFNFCTTENIF